MNEKPVPQHDILKRFVGDWTCTVESGAKPGEPNNTSHHTEHGRLLGGFWAVCEGRSAANEPHPFGSILTLGYDTLKGKYVGSFVASMMGTHWIYEGDLDAGGRVLTLHTSGPGFTDATKTAAYRDVIEFLGDTERTMTSEVQTDDGSWQWIMTARYRRQA